MTQSTIECDVLVVGAGAGGLAAAIVARSLGLSVIAAEKEPLFGGTTAWSGGWLWIPGNSLARAAGLKDDAESAKKYLRGQIGEGMDDAKVDAYLKHGSRMVDFFHERTAVKFVAGLAIPDFHAEAPGGATGRLVGAMPYDGCELGDMLGQLRPPLREMTVGGMAVAGGADLKQLAQASRSPASAWYALRRFAAYFWQRMWYGKGTWLVNGNALAGRLGRAAMDAGVRLMLGTPVDSLVERQGRVTGAMLRSPTGPIEVHARRGIVLSTGGFGRNTELRDRYFPRHDESLEHGSIAAPGNTGDGLAMALSVGAALSDKVSEAGGLLPVSRVRHRDGRTGFFPHLADRAKPGLIAVLPNGRRFANESLPYHDVVRQWLAACEGSAATYAYLVCDHRFIRRYGMGFAKPAPLPLMPYLRSGYLMRGETLSELAAVAGIDPAGLGRTIESYNAGAVSGTDTAFGRGDTQYSRFGGDPDCVPNPCVAPICNGPYYAIRVEPGSLSTFVGLRTDAAANVLREDGTRIEGLYAVGNDMASLSNGRYPSGGMTLGAAMTFGYLAAHHLAGREADSVAVAQSA